MDKTELLRTMRLYGPSGNRRVSFFINGKRFTDSKATTYIKDNTSDKSRFYVSFNKHKLPWWVGDWKYGMNQPKYTGGRYTDEIKLFFRVSRINMYITINN